MDSERWKLPFAALLGVIRARCPEWGNLTIPGGPMIGIPVSHDSFEVQAAQKACKVFASILFRNNTKEQQAAGQCPTLGGPLRDTLYFFLSPNWKTWSASWPSLTP